MEGDNLKWMEYFRQLIAQKHLHHTFWCFNANSGDTGGLVKDDFKTWDEEKYSFVKEVLWQTEDGKFIGLDHAVPLGLNGIALSDYDGVTITPAPVTPVAESEATEQSSSIASQSSGDAPDQKENTDPEAVFETFKKITRGLIITAIIAVLLIIVIVAVRISLKRGGGKKEAEEETNSANKGSDSDLILKDSVESVGTGGNNKELPDGVREDD